MSQIIFFWLSFETLFNSRKLFDGLVQKRYSSIGFAFYQRLAEFSGRTLIDVHTGSKRNDLHHGTRRFIDAIDDSGTGHPVASQA